ncbi:hypothetical protein ABZP36_029664 [Zizania latifolia]
MTGERCCITVPNPMQAGASDHNAAVFSPASSGGGGDCHSSPFLVVVVFTSHGRVFACVYSSQTSVWGEVISTPAPSPCELCEDSPALVGEALYWLLDGNRILEFKFGSQILALVERPPETHAIYKWNIRVARLGDYGLGLAAVKDFSLHLWVQEVADDGASKWVLHREIGLDTLLPLPTAPSLEAGRRLVGMTPVWISGLSEDGNVVFLRTTVGIFLVWLETMKFKKVSDTLLMKTVYPYASCYVPDAI